MLESDTSRAPGLDPQRPRLGKRGPAASLTQAHLPDTLTTSSPPDLASVAANAYADARALALDLHNARDGWALRALGVALALRDLADALHRPVTCRECGVVIGGAE